MSYEETAEDVARAVKRAAAAKHLDTKPELVNNVYPIIMGLLEASNERFLQLEEAVASIMDESDTIIQPDEADIIASALDAGEALCAAVEGSTPSKEVMTLIEAYRAASAQAAEVVMNAAVEDEEEDNEGDDEEDDEAEEGKAE